MHIQIYHTVFQKITVVLKLNHYSTQSDFTDCLTANKQTTLSMSLLENGTSVFWKLFSNLDYWKTIHQKNITDDVRCQYHQNENATPQRPTSKNSLFQHKNKYFLVTLFKHVWEFIFIKINMLKCLCNINATTLQWSGDTV